MQSIKALSVVFLITAAALIAAPVQAKDSGPYSNFNFIIVVDSGRLGGFTEVSGLATENEVVEYRDGGDPNGAAHKIPGVQKYSNVTLKRGVISGNTDLWDWRQMVIDGDIANARKNGSIVMVDAAMQPLAVWEFENGWPSKVEVHTERTADGSLVAIEELTIAHEFIARTK